MPGRLATVVFGAVLGRIGEQFGVNHAVNLAMDQIFARKAGTCHFRHEIHLVQAAPEWLVVVERIPGESGLSGAPPIDDAVAALQAITRVLTIAHVTVAAWGCASVIATALAARDGAHVTALVLERAIDADPATAERIAPDLPLRDEGTHWLTAWLMVRDNQIYDPWFAGTVAAQRRSQGNFDAQWLHDQTFEIIEARETYAILPRAAWRTGCSELLPDVTVPVHLGEPVAVLRSLAPTKEPA